MGTCGETSWFYCDPPRTGTKWFAVHVRARYEKFVGDMLVEKGYQTFVPLYPHPRHYAHCIKRSYLPVFPGYLFARFDASNRLPILITPGVISLLGAGKIPQPVDDTEIFSLQRAAEARYEITPCPYWKSGETGRVTKGPLAGLEGVVMQCKRSFRLVLSVTLLQRSVMLEIDSGSVEIFAPNRNLNASKIH